MLSGHGPPSTLNGSGGRFRLPAELAPHDIIDAGKLVASKTTMLMAASGSDCLLFWVELFRISTNTLSVDLGGMTPRFNFTDG